MNTGPYSREALAARIGWNAVALAEAAAAAAPNPGPALIERIRLIFEPSVALLTSQEPQPSGMATAA